MPQPAGIARAGPLLCAGALVELLALLGVLPERPDLTHALALPPMDLTFDIGTILAKAPGPLWFAAGLVVAVCTRATILSLMLGSLRKWPFALRFELLVLVPSFVAAELAFYGQSVLYSATFWAGVARTLASALLFSHVPWRGARSVIATAALGLFRGTRVPAVLSYFVALGVLGSITRGRDGAVVLVGTAVSALLTIATARRLSGPASSPAATWFTAVTAIALGAAFYLGGATHSNPGSTKHQGELVLVAGADTSSGHGSMFSMAPSSIGFGCDRTFYFSYAGPGNGASQEQAKCPITTGAPYSRRQTERPLGALAEAFRAQVDRLKAPVTVVTHSSGAWIALDAINHDSTTPVRNIVMLAPVTGSLGYPPPGRSEPGSVGASGMRLISEFARSDGFSKFEPDAPLARELLGAADGTRSIFERTLTRSLREFVVPSAYDVALFEASDPFGRAVEGCALAISHGAIPTSVRAAAESRAFLAHQAQPTCAPWPAWIAFAGAAFQLP